MKDGAFEMQINFLLQTLSQMTFTIIKIEAMNSETSLWLHIFFLLFFLQARENVFQQMFS